MMVRSRNNGAELNRYARWRLGLQGMTFGAVSYAMYMDSKDSYGSPYPWEWRRERDAKRQALIEGRSVEDITSTGKLKK